MRYDFGRTVTRSSDPKIEFATSGNLPFATPFAGGMIDRNPFVNDVHEIPQPVARPALPADVSRPEVTQRPLAFLPLYYRPYCETASLVKTPMDFSADGAGQEMESIAGCDEPKRQVAASFIVLFRFVPAPSPGGGGVHLVEGWRTNCKSKFSSVRHLRINAPTSGQQGSDVYGCHSWPHLSTQGKSAPDSWEFICF